MKYLIEARNELRRILTEFVENEPEDTPEYAMLLEFYKDLNYKVSQYKLDFDQREKTK